MHSDQGGSVIFCYISRQQLRPRSQLISAVLKKIMRPRWHALQKLRPTSQCCFGLSHFFLNLNEKWKVFAEGRDLESLRETRPVIKDFMRSFNVNSTSTNPHHSLFPEAAVHSSVLHWVYALMSFNAKPALVVGHHQRRFGIKRPPAPVLN